MTRAAAAPAGILDRSVPEAVSECGADWEVCELLADAGCELAEQGLIAQSRHADHGGQGPAAAMVCSVAALGLVRRISSLPHPKNATGSTMGLSQPLGKFSMFSLASLDRS